MPRVPRMAPMSRVAGVVRWHHRTYTGALDEGPAMVGLEIVIGLAQRCQLVEAGMPGRAVLEAFDMVVLEARPPPATFPLTHRLFPQQRDLLRRVRTAPEVGDVAHIHPVGDHQLQDRLPEHGSSGGDRDGSEPG